MSKLSPFFLGVFLAAFGLGVPTLPAAESLPPVAPGVSVAPATSGKATPGESAPAEGATPGVDSAVVAAQQEVRDPFASGSNVAASVPQAGPAITVELQGIGFGSKDAYAVIGGEVFFTGEEKNGIKLVEVRRGEADIIVNGEPMTCLLFSDQGLKNVREREKRKRAVSLLPVGRES